MLIDPSQCGINVLPQINDALRNATDIVVAGTVDVVGTDADAIKVGLQQLQKLARSKFF